MEGTPGHRDGCIHNHHRSSFAISAGETHYLGKKDLRRMFPAANQRRGILIALGPLQAPYLLIIARAAIC